MKIQEIINFEPRLSKQDRWSYVDKMHSMGADELGSGSFGSVFDTQSNKRLGQVTKIGSAGSLSKRDAADLGNGYLTNSNATELDEDGYILYLKTIFDLKSNNPYFPRFSDIVLLRNRRTNTISYRVNLQHLVKFKSAKIYENDELMKSLYDDMFMVRTDSYDSKMYAVGIATNINKYAISEDYSLIKDTKLIQALSVINNVKKAATSILKIDLSHNNMMWRITGNRPQLVLTDPLA